MSWIRARTEEQKELRISEIVDATARLYEKRSFEDITFVLIAKEADFTRSNLYKYFNTKEEVFLELIKHDIVRWRKEVVDTFKNQHYSIKDFAKIWVDIQIRHKRMIGLFTILYTTLEKNSSLQSLISFKKKIKEELELIAAVLMDIMPFFTLETVVEFIFSQLALAIGTYPMLNLTDAQKEAMDTVGLTSDPQYFKSIYSNSIEYLLKGLE